jgi:hypothetical protein
MHIEGCSTAQNHLLRLFGCNKDVFCTSKEHKLKPMPPLKELKNLSKETLYKGIYTFFVGCFITEKLRRYKHNAVHGTC